DHGGRYDISDRREIGVDPSLFELAAPLRGIAAKSYVALLCLHGCRRNSRETWTLKPLDEPTLLVRSEHDLDAFGAARGVTYFGDNPLDRLHAGRGVTPQAA